MLLGGGGAAVVLVRLADPDPSPELLWCYVRLSDAWIGAIPVPTMNLRDVKPSSNAPKIQIDS
jgi:hypothetical protein